MNTTLTLREAVDAFLLASETEGRHALNTTKQYRHACNRFCAVIGGDTPLAAIDRDTICVFLTGLSAPPPNGEGLKPRTTRLIYSSIRSLFNHFVDRGMVEDNPTHDIKLPKLGAAKRLLVNEEEVCALLQAVERIKARRKKCLYRAILIILLTTAIRHDELCNLKITDIDLAAIDPYLLISKGKGNKSRKMFLPPVCIDALKEWLAVRPSACSHDYLFARTRGWRVGYEGLWTIVEEIAALAGYPNSENIKPHSLRHYAASSMLEKGVDLSAVQTILGHTSIQTTAIYLHTSERRLKQVAGLIALPNWKLMPSEPQAEPPSVSEPEQAEETDADLENGRKARRSGGGQKHKGYVPAHKRRELLKPFRPLPPVVVPATTVKPEQTPMEKNEADTGRRAAWRKEPPKPQPVAKKVSLPAPKRKK